MYHYAQINDEGMVVGESWLSGPVEARLLFAVPDDFNAFEHRYDFDTGEWVDYTPSEPEDNTLSDLDAAIYDTQANTAYLVCLAELNNMEV